mmetsp:Transcript_5853/g.9078  ORF Transcript_5853/g.9078 Transcript_5853/m.9078 type:complete len:344 (-) Transcript_5853:70-1101(-)
MSHGISNKQAGLAGGDAPQAVAGAVFGDPRNEDILIYMNRKGPGSGKFVPRQQAVVSVFDSGFLMGDGVWEGLRLYNGKWFCIDKHLKRLYEACKFMDIDIGISPREIERDLNELAKVNKMKSGCHARLMVTRGEKYTPYQGPAVNKPNPTIVCIAEHKEAATIDSPAQQNGITLHTVHVRRGNADVQDQKLNSHSKINCITACIAAAKAGADEGLMLDPRGQVATCNSVHFFIVRDNEVWTSYGNYCIPGITRGNILELCHQNGIPAHEKDFSLYEVYGADEAFVTGTFGGVTPVSHVDGRMIGSKLYSNWKEGEPKFTVGPMVRKLQNLYNSMVLKQCGGM